MTHAESTLFVDLIGGGYLWGGVPAEVFVAQQTTPQARRDKAKTREYRCWITVNDWLPPRHDYRISTWPLRSVNNGKRTQLGGAEV